MRDIDSGRSRDGHFSTKSEYSFQSSLLGHTFKTEEKESQEVLVMVSRKWPYIAMLVLTTYSLISLSILYGLGIAEETNCSGQR
jgi:hypothetical protein